MSTNPRVEGLWTMRVGEREASLKALEEAIVKHGGEPVLIFDRLRSDAAFTQRVAKLLLRDGIESSIHHKLARAVMSYNFWGAEEWSSFFGVNFTKKQLREVKEFPWSLDVLNSTCPLCGNRVRDCHFAFVGLDRINGKPLTILKLQGLLPLHSLGESSWYSQEKFAREITMSFRWYLLHQNVVPESEDKTYGDQKAMLTADYEVPSAITEVMKDLLVFRKTGKYANSSRYARCECVTSEGKRVNVRDFEQDGINISAWSENDCFGGTGIAASRKFPSA